LARITLSRSTLPDSIVARFVTFGPVITSFPFGSWLLHLSFCGNDPPLFPYGHFYSPIVDADEIAGRADAIWNENTALAGIDLNDARHVEILQAWFPKFIGEYDYPDEGDPNNPAGYFNLNDQFSWLDARALFVFLRHLQPKRVVEVGSGFSSLLIADVNHRFLGERMEFTCVEPYPREFLRRGMAGLTRLVDQKAQDVGFAVFDSLEAGGFLFIDSSHVAKTGSDVNFLFFDVLPRLKAGVFVHVHDIFLPMEYPRDWVIEAKPKLEWAISASCALDVLSTLSRGVRSGSRRAIAWARRRQGAGPARRARDGWRQFLDRGDRRPSPRPPARRFVGRVERVSGGRRRPSRAVFDSLGCVGRDRARPKMGGFPRNAG